MIKVKCSYLLLSIRRIGRWRYKPDERANSLRNRDLDNGVSVRLRVRNPGQRRIYTSLSSETWSRDPAKLREPGLTRTHHLLKPQ